MTFSPSPQQQAIFDAISRGDHNILVDAKAGSGKTTTIVEGTKRIAQTTLLPPSIVFLAFNKSIAETLAQKLPRGVRSSTFHSLGLRALKSSSVLAQNFKIDARKCAKMVWNVMDRDEEDMRAVIQLVSLAKSRWGQWSANYCEPDIVYNQTSFWRDIAVHHDVPLANPSRAYAVAARVLSRSNEMLDVIDFDDMLYLPVLHNCHFDPQDWIFVDEAQDTNDIQLEILNRLCRGSDQPRKDIGGFDVPVEELNRISVAVEKPSSVLVMSTPVMGQQNYRPSVPSTTTAKPSRLVAVGDPHQAIYGFRGANADSMSRISSRFSCKTYPLSVSYRCSKAVVKEAQRYLV